MRLPRPVRLAAAGRPLVTALAMTLLAPGGARAAQAVLSGIVVDPADRPVPRALIHALASDGSASTRVFADEAGRFDIAVADPAACRVEVSLAGFVPAAIPCAAFPAGSPLRVALTVAPVRETVLVTATRTDAPTSQAGASATVFTADDLERRQMPLLADLLATTPGAMLVRSGGPGSLTSLFVRGGESDYNKILLDGVPLNEAGGTFYLNGLTTEHLERVEIVRGAYSSLFGSDAMASVIQLFTRRADGSRRRPRGSLQIDGGTYGTLHAAASVAGAAGRIDYAAGAAQFNSDNRTANSRLESTTLHGNVGIAVGESATLRVVGRAELQDVGTPGPTAFGRSDLDAFFERGDGVFSISLDQQLTGAVRQRAMYSVAASGQTSTNLVLDPPFTAIFEGRTAVRSSSDFLNDSHADLRRHHAAYQADWRLADGPGRGTQLLTLLADWNGARASLEDRLSGSRTSHSRDNFGASAQHQMLWPRVFLTLGARLERNESFGAVAVPRASVVHVLREAAGALGDTRLKVGGGGGIKEPTMLESYSLSRFFLGNPDLRPERSRSFEAGLDQRFAGDRAKIELAWFDNRFRDIISLRTDPATFESQYFNIGVTRARGFEAVALAAPTSAIRARAAYTLLDSEIVETATPGHPLFAAGQWAFRRPRHSGSAGATIQWDRLTADVSGVFVGRFVDSDFGLFEPPLVENPGHTTWDARLAVRLSSGLTGLLSIDNLTNRDYSAPFGYQPLGRVIRAGARAAF